MRILSILLITALAVTSCGKKAKESKPEMYQDSELAKLMRTMYSEHEGIKELIQKGEVPADFPESYKKMMSSEATPNMDIGEPFKAFASQYHTDMDSLKSSDSLNLVSNHNRVVQSCVTCHEQHCSGPIAKIEKLYIK